MKQQLGKASAGKGPLICQILDAVYEKTMGKYWDWVTTRNPN